MLTPTELQTRALYENSGFARQYARGFSEPGELFFTFLELLPKGRILDLGCGPGNDGCMFLDWDYEYIGIDFAYQILSAGKEQHDGRVFVAQMDMGYLGFIPDTFDGFWACSSLMHVPRTKIAQVLQDIHRVVRHQGVGLIYLRKGDFERMEKDPLVDTKVIVSAYELDVFSSLLQTSGFEVVKARPHLLAGGLESMSFFVRNIK